MSFLSKIQIIPDKPVTLVNVKKYIINVFYDGMANILITVYVIGVGKNVICQVHCDV